LVGKENFHFLYPTIYTRYIAHPFGMPRQVINLKKENINKNPYLEQLYYMRYY